jgi:hypothetical protein
VRFNVLKEPYFPRRIMRASTSLLYVALASHRQRSVVQLGIALHPADLARLGG